MKLDLLPLEKALSQMEEALAYCNSPLAENNVKLAKHLKAAAIQAFGFSYDLSFKMIKRYLEQTESNSAIIDRMDFNELIRTANERDLLLSELEVWHKYRRARGTTIHTYNKDKAAEVYENIENFLSDTKYLLNQLKSLTNLAR